MSYFIFGFVAGALFVIVVVISALKRVSAWRQ